MNADARPLLSLDEALARLVAGAVPHAIVQTESVSTFDALGRVLAAEVLSALDVPPEDNSSMDGYAVRVADIAEKGVVLPISQRIPAGHPALPLQPGTCARIFTGARVPHGADAIVMQEDTREVGGDFHAVHIDVVPRPGQHLSGRAPQRQRQRVPRQPCRPAAFRHRRRYFGHPESSTSRRQPAPSRRQPVMPSAGNCHESPPHFRPCCRMLH